MTLFYGHKPRIILNLDNSIEANSITVENPEVSQAFYAILRNNNSYFSIYSPNNFKMYLDLSTPSKLSDDQKNFYVNIYRKDNDKLVLFKELHVNDFNFFYEEYGCCRGFGLFCAYPRVS